MINIKIGKFLLFFCKLFLLYFKVMIVFLYNYLYFINFNNVYNNFYKKKYHFIKIILIFCTLVFN